MNNSVHFQTRTQQRAITPAMVDIIFDLGQSNAKGDLVLMGKKDIEQAMQNLNALKRDLQKMRSSGGAGIAYNGATLITTFHHYKKFKRG